MKTRVMARCLGIVALLASLATAEAAGPLIQLTSFPLAKPALELVVEGDFAYMVTDVGLTIVNIADPEAPHVEGSVTLGGQGLGIALKGSHVYVANRTKDFQVVDVSNPAAPHLVATKALPGYTWDVAVKDDVAYVASFTGELYLFDITDPVHPQQIGVLGISEWTSAGQDATNLAKLNSYVTAGSAKLTGVSVTGSTMVVAGWNYGRFYYYDVSDAAHPQFRGTHYTPFAFRTEADPDRDAAYVFAAFGASSGIYSVTLSTLGPSFSTRYNTCTGCDYFKTTATDWGGLTVSPNGKYVVTVFGKRGELRVLDVTNRADITSADWLPIPRHGTKTAETMGVAIKGNYIFSAVGTLGLLVHHFDGLSN